MTIHRIIKFHLLALCWCLTVLPFASSARAAEPKNSPFGINGCGWSHLGANTPKFDRTAGLGRMAALKEAGATWDRFDLWWGRVEPEKGKFFWRDYDWVFEQYRKNNIEPMPILCYASAWSKDNAAPVTDDERQLYARFVRETVKRYKGVVHTWEIWNEPNILPFWSPKPSARDYTELLKVAYPAAKEADPNCTIVGCVTAGADVAFIEDVLTGGAGDYFDAVSFHPYQGDLGSLSPDRGGLAMQIQSIRALLAAYGYAKPLYISEIGHRTTGTAGETEVTPEQQAAYLVRSYVIALAGGVERVFWFNLQDWEEYWGIIRQDFSRKTSVAAYRQMVEQLSSKRPIGTLDLGDGVSAVVFAPLHEQPTTDNMVAVVWKNDDTESQVKLPGTRALHGPARAELIGPDHAMPVGMAPVYVTQLTPEAIAAIVPLPPAPRIAPQRHRDAPEAKLPTIPAAWHVDTADRRFAVAVAFADPLTIPRPVTIPKDQVPKDLSGVTCFDAIADEDPAAGPPPKQVAERDLDGNLVLVVPPGSSGTFYLYPRSGDRKPALKAEDDAITNGILTVRFKQRKYADAIELNKIYTSRADELGGILTASYKDTEDGWPRTNESARVLEHHHRSGMLLSQYRSRISFGIDDAIYEFTFTLYDGLPQVSYRGDWISPGEGAIQQVNLGDSFPDGTLVTGMYSEAKLPVSGVGYGHACVIQPSDHRSVTAVLVSPEGQLNTPSWSEHAVVGAGHFYQTIFPSTVTAEYFWYPEPPGGDLVPFSRAHYRAVAFPPVLAAGPLERKPS